MKYLLKIAYLGGGYHGFQAQNNAPSVQRVLTEAANRLFAAETAVTGCSRTDAGVHAKGFCVTLEPSEPHSSVKTESIPRAMSTLLPPDIGVLSAEAVPDDFHPRYSAKGKEYEYTVFTGSYRDPFLSGRAWFHPMNVTCDALDNMRAAAGELEGRKDFASFMAAGSKITDTVREIKYCRLEKEGDVLKITVAADGFLYNMVRIIVGTLISVGEGKIAAEDMKKIIEAKDRAAAGVTAPPEGLCLMRVFY